MRKKYYHSQTRAQQPSNTVDCLTLQIQLTKTYNHISYSSQIQLTNMLAGGAPLQTSTGEHICHFRFLGTADYIIFVSRI